MFQFIEKGMCGGISYIANRYGKANNKQMKNYDEKAPSKYITYLDANNLYGCARSQYLPTGGFRWLTEKELNKIDLAKYTEDSKFDNSDYPKQFPYFDITNKKVIGKFKDEAGSIPINEFVGLRLRKYSYMKDNEKGGKTAKE